MGVDGSLTDDVNDVDCGMLMYDRNERELVQGTCDEPDDENGDEGDDPEQEEDGESDEDEINEDDALGESDESDEESDSGSEEENLDEDTEEEVSDEEKNADEDTEEEESGDDDDKSEEARSKDVKVSTDGVISAQPFEQKNKQNKHVVFDEEESENLPSIDFLGGSSKSEDEEPEDSDSDAAPEEVTLAAGKKLADGEDMKIKKELERTKQLVKEARKRKHEKNKLQQEQKRQRLENLSSKRLPEELLKAVVAEQKIQPRQKVAIQKKRKKVKTFIADSNPADENVDEEGFITLQHGVHVRAVKQEIKKNISIANQAAEFRQKALYGMRIKRMPGKELQQMKVRQEKSGKNFLVTR